MVKCYKAVVGKHSLKVGVEYCDHLHFLNFISYQSKNVQRLTRIVVQHNSEGISSNIYHREMLITKLKVTFEETAYKGRRAHAFLIKIKADDVRF